MELTVEALTPLEIGIFLVYLLAVVTIAFGSGRKGHLTPAERFVDGLIRSEYRRS
jgi:hypothetical protein